MRISKFALVGALAVGAAVGMTPKAHAAYVVTLEQVGSNVVATGSGTIDTAALSVVNPKPGSFSPELESDIGFILTGSTTPTPLSVYGFATGPTGFGSGSSTIAASSGSGETVGITGAIGALALATSYVSGTSISDTATYDNATLASLGATPGTYEWTWGAGATADSFTVQVGPAATVPEPASLALLMMGLAGVGMVLRVRRT